MGDDEAIGDEALWRAIAGEPGEPGERDAKVKAPDLCEAPLEAAVAELRAMRAMQSKALCIALDLCEAEVDAGVEAVLEVLRSMMAEAKATSIDFQPPPEHLGRRWHILQWDDGHLEVARWFPDTRTWTFSGDAEEYGCSDEMFRELTWVGVVEPPAERGAPR